MCASKDKWTPHPRRQSDGFVRCGRVWFLDAPSCRAALALQRTRRPTWGTGYTDEEIEMRDGERDGYR